MAFPYLLPLFLFSSVALLCVADSKLSVDYYKKTCPDFHNVVQEVIMTKQMTTPTTAAGTLRVFFHDCVVGGCDASLLLSSNAKNKAERDAEINLSLPGDAFEVVIKAKTVLELKCPGVVSCADILAEATRDLVTMVGGPFYKVPLGRLDSFNSSSVGVEGHIAHSNASVTEMIAIFALKNYTIQEMVALSGAHTIGFSHCHEFAYRIFNFSKTSEVDPTMNPTYAQALRKLCANYTTVEGTAAFNDAITPGKFDNVYFTNLKKGLGLLASDQLLASDPRTKPFVDMYAANQTAFFDDFARVMERMNTYMVKTGKQGEVRRRCDVPNDLQAI